MSDEKWKNAKWETGYDRFLKFGSWMNAFIYGTPAAVLLLAMYFLGVSAEWWTPVLLIYAIAALADMLNYGFMAANIQMKTIYDYWEQKQLGDNEMN